MTYALKTYKVTFVRKRKRAPIGSHMNMSEKVVEIAETVYQDLDADREHCVIFCLNRKNRVEGFKVISTGSLTASMVHPREVYHVAIVLRAAAVVAVHNHPSGDPAPSLEDIGITAELRKAGELLGFPLLDHVILGSGRYYSFSDEGEL
jgi:DNA repair protein RadC